jgi:hypothetical protein
MSKQYCVDPSWKDQLVSSEADDGEAAAKVEDAPAGTIRTAAGTGATSRDR